MFTLVYLTLLKQFEELIDCTKILRSKMLIYEEVCLWTFTWRRCTCEYCNGATLRIIYLLCLEADTSCIAGDHIRPTFEKLIDAHPSLSTGAQHVY